MASENVPTTRGQQMQQLPPIQPIQPIQPRQQLQPIQQLQPMTRPTSEIVPTTRAQPLSQATSEIVPTTGGQPFTTTQSHLGEVPAVWSHPTTNVPGILMNQPTNTIVPSSRSSQLMRGERQMFSTSDDTSMMKQIQSTHAPDGREFDVKPLLLIIQDIIHRATPTSHTVGAQSQDHINTWEEKAIHSGYSDILQLLAYPISKTNNELICKCSGGGDAHTITMALFHSLSSYSWEAKATIAFAAFAVSYAEFWLVAQLYTTNPLAKSVVVLKDLPEILEPTEALKKKFEAVNNLIKAILDVIECIIKFKELFSQPEMESATAHILIAVYWTVRCIVTCSITLLNLIALGHRYVASIAEASELNNLAHKLADKIKDLEMQMDLINQKIEEKSQNDAFLELILLSETPHMDNMKILRALIYAKEDQLPLYDGTHKRRASLDILRRKHLLLLISELEMSHEELSMLHQIYTESRQQPPRVESHYEVVWLPVVDRLSPWQEAKQKQFELFQNCMQWYSVVHPMMIGPAVIKFIKEIWGFNGKPQLVVLDPQGKESNRNALHMMWIWGSTAFPFTKAKEEQIWRDETWGIALLADSIDLNLFLWLNQNKYICLYGGEDIEWIRKFTNTARAVANDARIPLEMLYIGKSDPKERVRRNNSIIQVENLSHILPDLTLIWYFWVRLESMWHSKIQHGMTVENDPIMQEIATMLSFDGSDQGWAVFSRGSHEMAKGKGDIVLQCLNEYDRWKDNVDTNGFMAALNGGLLELHSPNHCNRLILTGQNPEKVACAECGRPMERFTMYRCCND